MKAMDQGFQEAHRELVRLSREQGGIFDHGSEGAVRVHRALLEGLCKPAPVFQLNIPTGARTDVSFQEYLNSFDLNPPFDDFWLLTDSQGSVLSPPGEPLMLRIHRNVNASEIKFEVQGHEEEDGRVLSFRCEIVNNPDSIIVHEALLNHAPFRGFSPADGEDLETSLRQTAAYTLAFFLLQYNRPTNFVVEYRPHGFDQDNARRKKKKLRPRRPINLILGREETIRVITQGNKRQGEKLRSGHMRRGHWRTFHHERYGDRVGQRTWIKAHWVGPEEGRDEHGNIYRVRLDR